MIFENVVHLMGRRIARLNSDPLQGVIGCTQLSGAARGAGGPRPVTIIYALCDDWSPKIDHGSRIAVNMDTPARHVSSEGRCVDHSYMT